MEQKYTYIDLFAGCGGLSLGLHNAGWHGLFAIEKANDAFLTLKHNLIDNKKHFSWPNWLPQTNLDINRVLKKYKNQLEGLQGKVDMIVGGPPCQGFSIAGRRKEDDQRNRLINSYVKFIKLVKPKIIFFENVKGFTLEFKKNKDKGKIYSEYVLNKLDRAGYTVKGELINFADFGIPQKRTRFILVGIRKDIAEANDQLVSVFFEKIKVHKDEFLVNKNLPIQPKLEDAISDLLLQNGTVVSPDCKSFQAGLYSTAISPYQNFMREGTTTVIPDSHRFAKHKADTVNRMEFILENSRKGKDVDKHIKEKFGMKKQRVVLLDKQDTSPTLTAHPDDCIHYSEPRILTVREYARIQSFPDWFEFKGQYTTGGERRRYEVPRYTQIGNAIPPLFGEQSGLVLKDLL